MGLFQPEVKSLAIILYDKTIGLSSCDNTDSDEAIDLNSVCSLSFVKEIWMFPLATKLNLQHQHVYFYIIFRLNRGRIGDD